MPMKSALMYRSERHEKGDEVVCGAGGVNRALLLRDSAGGRQQHLWGEPDIGPGRRGNADDQRYGRNGGLWGYC